MSILLEYWHDDDNLVGKSSANQPSLAPPSLLGQSPRDDAKKIQIWWKCWNCCSKVEMQIQMEENLRGATDLLLLWHILPHLEISPTLSTTPQHFLCSFYHTLKFLMLILRHLGVSWVHSTTPWIFSSSFCDTLSFLVLILQYEHLLISPQHSLASLNTT